MAELPSHTLHAQQGFDFADIFSYKFKERRIGDPPRQVLLKEPDGPSTAGGKRARQPLVLQDGAGDVVVCGWVDLPGRAAEVRGFAYVNEQYRARHGRALEVPADEFEALMKEISAFFRVNRLSVHRAERLPGARGGGGAARPGGPPLSVGLILALGILGGIALGLLLFG